MVLTTSCRRDGTEACCSDGNTKEFQHSSTPMYDLYRSYQPRDEGFDISFGRVMVNVLPSPNALVTVISPS